MLFKVGFYFLQQCKRTVLTLVGRKRSGIVSGERGDPRRDLERRCISEFIEILRFRSESNLDP